MSIQILTQRLHQTPIINVEKYRRIAASYYSMASAILLGQPDNLEIQSLEVLIDSKAEQWHVEYVGLSGLMMNGLLVRSEADALETEYPDIQAIAVRSIHLRYDDLLVAPVIARTTGAAEDDHDISLYERIISDITATL